MEAEVSDRETDWPLTRRAVADFRKLLLCSKCSNVMAEPVCLGTCEHMLCRSCAGPQAGSGCVVCHSPAWVKDVRVNKQLSNIIQSFSRLESLLAPTEHTDSPLDETQTEPQSRFFKFKMPFKIWHSPRSHKIRCRSEKPPEEMVGSGSRSPAEKAAAAAARREDLSVFNFVSSQESESASPQRSNTRKRKRKKGPVRNAVNRKPLMPGASKVTGKQTKQDMKKKLQSKNQQWGLSEGADTLKENQDVCAEGVRRSSRKVSFIVPAVSSDEPEPEGPQGSAGVLSSGRSILRGSDSRAGSSVQPGPQGQEASDPKPHADTANQDELPHLMPSSKRARVEEKPNALETTPKRPRASSSRRRQSAGGGGPDLLRSPSATSPASNKTSRNPEEAPGGSPIFRGRMQKRSPCTQSPLAGRLSPGSPAFMKRNHKGETPLHLAAIKGDVEAVKELLDQGAKPNLKDHAGWTPLHEACNLGHGAVVEALIAGGALLNTTGYENDSPLHDAVQNGHAAIAKLLLQHGASHSVLNLHGKRPVDYAVTLEMQEVFQHVTEGNQQADVVQSPSAGPPVVSDQERVVFLSTKLSSEEQADLELLGEEMGWTKAEAFSDSVTHVVLPELMINTQSALMGVLAGCWLVSFSWVKACRREGERVEETQHEAGEGAQRSRINKGRLLPRLLDGCHFYLHGSFTRPSRDALTELLREGGGGLLCRRPKPDSDVTQTLVSAAYHAAPASDQALFTHYIIYDPQGSYRPAAVRSGRVWSAPTSWVVDCVASFQLLPVPQPQH
ncbi:BRCA1-associated RING domain protein 1 [Genypterus blacodes]|uniref:BRCA1-associated RING domain protein 1 n=1 Tax=Genypterus blacodes TaxID=154954 RepID=UPI003F76AADB